MESFDCAPVLDCSQLSIFPYFYLIIELVDNIARELNASVKEDLTGWGVGIEKNRGVVDIFGKK